MDCAGRDRGYGDDGGLVLDIPGFDVKLEKLEEIKARHHGVNPDAVYYSFVTTDDVSALGRGTRWVAARARAADD
jgi:hypothetical protein